MPKKSGGSVRGKVRFQLCLNPKSMIDSEIIAFLERTDFKSDFVRKLIYDYIKEQELLQKQGVASGIGKVGTLNGSLAPIPKKRAKEHNADRGEQDEANSLSIEEESVPLVKYKEEIGSASPLIVSPQVVSGQRTSFFQRAGKAE